MARVVGKDDWVAFPLQQTNAMQVEWSDKRTAQSATYYMDKCWFGKPNASSEDDVELYTKGLNIKEGGITMIFIAAESIDERTAGSPLIELRDNHIRDRMARAAQAKNQSQTQCW